MFGMTWVLRFPRVYMYSHYSTFSFSGNCNCVATLLLLPRTSRVHSLRLSCFFPFRLPAPPPIRFCCIWFPNPHDQHFRLVPAFSTYSFSHLSIPFLCWRPSSYLVAFPTSIHVLYCSQLWQVPCLLSTLCPSLVVVFPAKRHSPSCQVFGST